MNPLHIHLGVDNMDQSIRFYSVLFGAEPVKTKPDYAKWMLDNPHVNFAISTRSRETGLNHLGIQVDEESELTELRDRLKKADMAVEDDGDCMLLCEVTKIMGAGPRRNSLGSLSDN